MTIYVASTLHVFIPFAPGIFFLAMDPKKIIQQNKAEGSVMITIPLGIITKRLE